MSNQDNLNSFYKFLNFSKNFVSVLTGKPKGAVYTVWATGLGIAILFYIISPRIHPDPIFKYVIVPGICLCCLILPSFQYKTAFDIRNKIITHHTLLFGIQLRHAILKFDSIKLILIHKYKKAHSANVQSKVDMGINLYMTDHQNKRYLLAVTKNPELMDEFTSKLSQVVDIDMPNKLDTELDGANW